MFIRNTSRVRTILAMGALLLPFSAFRAEAEDSSPPSVRAFKARLEHPPQTGRARFLYKTPANADPLQYEAAWKGSDYFLATTRTSQGSDSRLLILLARGCWESRPWSYADGNISYVEKASETRPAPGAGGDFIIRDLLTLGIQGLRIESLRWTTNGFTASRADGMPLTGRLWTTNNVVQAVDCNLGPGPGIPWLRVEYQYVPTNSMPRRIVAFRFAPGTSRKALFAEYEIQEWHGTLSAEEWAQYAPEVQFPAAKVRRITKDGLILEKRGDKTVLLNPPRRQDAPPKMALRVVLLILVIAGAAGMLLARGKRASKK